MARVVSERIGSYMVKHITPVASRELALSEALRTLQEYGTPFHGDRRALRSALGLTV